jgi:hypothetical protein
MMDTNNENNNNKSYQQNFAQFNYEPTTLDIPMFPIQRSDSQATSFSSSGFYGRSTSVLTPNTIFPGFGFNQTLPKSVNLNPKVSHLFERERKMDSQSNSVTTSSALSTSMSEQKLPVEPLSEVGCSLLFSLCLIPLLYIFSLNSISLVCRTTISNTNEKPKIMIA